MLRVGLTGGIGAGKSTVSRALVALGAVLVDADVLAREVVAAGTPGLGAVVAEFGTGVLTAQGELDRPALGRIVFADPARRAALNAIVHPLVAARRAELGAAAPADAVVVEDVPLLVETGAAPGYPLVVVVEADADERLRRLVADRGLSREDAAARIAAQADDAQRRAAADVLLPNPRRPEGAPDPLPALVEQLWTQRLVPFEAALRAGTPAPPLPGAPSAGDLARVRARLRHATGFGGQVDLGVTASWPLRGLVSGAVDPTPALRGLGFVGHEDRMASADPGCPVEVVVAVREVVVEPDRREL